MPLDTPPSDADSGLALLLDLRAALARDAALSALCGVLRQPDASPTAQLRAASAILTPPQASLVRAARTHLALYADMADMVRLGAYKPGSDAALDAAIRTAPRIEAMLTQSSNDATSLDISFSLLQAALQDG